MFSGVYTAIAIRVRKYRTSRATTLYFVDKQRSAACVNPVRFPRVRISLIIFFRQMVQDDHMRFQFQTRYPHRKERTRWH